jgi:hypothetical protein
MKIYIVPKDVQLNALTDDFMRIHGYARRNDALARLNLVLGKEDGDYSPVALEEEIELAKHGITKRPVHDGLIAGYGDYRRKVLELAHGMEWFNLREMMQAMYRCYRHAEQPRTIEELNAQMQGQQNGVNSALRYWHSKGELDKDGIRYRVTPNSPL